MDDGRAPLTPSPLPLAGEGGAQRRVRALGRKPDAVEKARDLRHASTGPERLLWSYLRNRHLDGFRFKRQQPVGPFFADFLCPEVSLVVEVDGGQHSDSPRDVRRDRLINDAGYSVLRFWNNEITANLSGVLQVIRSALHGTPSPGARFAPATLSRQAGEGKKED